MANIVKTVKYIMDQHKGQRGIIHTGNMKISKYIKEHLDKLVDGYNDSGFRDLFLVSYVELERSKFPSFWERYKKKVKELGTGNFTVNTKVAPEEDDSSAWIKSIKITYDYAGEDIRVYHICARVAE